MPELFREYFYPSSEDVEEFHDTIIEQRGTRGHMSRGMVKGCLEWAGTYVFNTMPFPTLLSQAAALMYGFITFHPFTDGNKRTALMTTAFFFFLNGYTLLMSPDAPEFTKSVAERCLDSEHATNTEICRIEDWLKSHVMSRGITRLLYKIRIRSPIMGELVLLFAVAFWNAGARGIFRKFLH